MDIASEARNIHFSNNLFLEGKEEYRMGGKIGKTHFPKWMTYDNNNFPRFEENRGKG
jgi:hypothetical protein